MCYGGGQLIENCLAVDLRKENIKFVGNKYNEYTQTFNHEFILPKPKIYFEPKTFIVKYSYIDYYNDSVSTEYRNMYIPIDGSTIYKHTIGNDNVYCEFKSFEITDENIKLKTFITERYHSYKISGYTNIEVLIHGYILLGIDVF